MYSAGVVTREKKNVTYSAPRGPGRRPLLKRAPAYIIACIHIYARRWKRVRKVDDGGGRTRLS